MAQHQRETSPIRRKAAESCSKSLAGPCSSSMVTCPTWSGPATPAARPQNSAPTIALSAGWDRGAPRHPKRRSPTSRVTSVSLRDASARSSDKSDAQAREIFPAGVQLLGTSKHLCQLRKLYPYLGYGIHARNAGQARQDREHWSSIRRCSVGHTGWPRPKWASKEGIPKEAIRLHAGTLGCYLRVSILPYNIPIFLASISGWENNTVAARVYRQGGKV
ncbi:hypothetical protein F4808DRAFT_324281 [Astrocystis sublimbata]|nr:hypothetical protein F4808DRAFT_324281 [Astrocystis sublimbata]